MNTPHCGREVDHWGQNLPQLARMNVVGFVDLHGERHHKVTFFHITYQQHQQFNGLS